MILTENHGPLILSSNYWGSEMERANKRYVSVDAGAVRLLMPASLRHEIEEMRSAQYVVLSRGPWPNAGLPDAVEFLFEDGTDSPFAIQLSPESFEMIPAEPPEGREWVLSVWDLKKGKAHKALERRCHWRRVPKIPWLKPWGE
jgi:hypothetical protein